MGVAFYVSCLKSYEIAGFSPSQTMRHYGGSYDIYSDAVEYEYNEENLQKSFFDSLSYTEIIGTMHVHAFMIPVIIFVLSRILSMTKAGEGIKITVYSAAFVGTIMNMSGPFFIRFVSDTVAVSLIASYIILGLCFITFISLPMFEMWVSVIDDRDYWD